MLMHSSNTLVNLKRIQTKKVLRLNLPKSNTEKRINSHAVEAENIAKFGSVYWYHLISLTKGDVLNPWI